MKPLMQFSLLLTVLALVTMGSTQDVLAALPAAAGGWEILGEHTVLYGETLYCLGRAYGVDPWAIATQNDIAHPDLIQPGVVLDIPNVPDTLPPGPICTAQFGDTKPEPPASCGGCVCSVTHAVQWGETLTYISINYGVDMWSIARCNCIDNLNYIRWGESLCIP